MMPRLVEDVIFMFVLLAIDAKNLRKLFPEFPFFFSIFFCLPSFSANSLSPLSVLLLPPLWHSPFAVNL